MKSRPIGREDIHDLLVESLPTHPTAPAAFGGRGYTATEMKAAFDRLPLYLVDRLNDLVDDLTTLSAQIDALGMAVDLLSAERR